MRHREKWGNKSQRRERDRAEGKGQILIRPRTTSPDPASLVLSLQPPEMNQVLSPGPTVAILMNPEGAPCGLKTDSDQSAVIGLSSPKAVR